MPNFDFFAAGDDHRAVLEFVFNELKCDVYELSSEPGCSCAQFRSSEEIMSLYGFTDWSELNRSILLQLHPHEAGGEVTFKETILKYPASPDKAVKYSSQGWGLIQLYLEPPRRGVLQSSHTNHNSETRANTWHSTITDMGSPSAWNWAAVSRFSRQLNSFIRKSAVDKIYSQVVMPQARAMRASGLKFWPWDRDDAGSKLE